MNRWPRVFPAEALFPLCYNTRRRRPSLPSPSRLPTLHKRKTQFIRSVVHRCSVLLPTCAFTGGQATRLYMQQIALHCALYTVLSGPGLPLSAVCAEVETSVGSDNTSASIGSFTRTSVSTFHLLFVFRHMKIISPFRCSGEALFQFSRKLDSTLRTPKGYRIGYTLLLECCWLPAPLWPYLSDVSVKQTWWRQQECLTSGGDKET